LDGDGLRRLTDSWLIAMEAAKLSPHTIKNYRTGVLQLLDWCDANGYAADLSDPEPVRLWLASMARAGRQASTMQVRLAAVRAYAKWLIEEDEVQAHGVGRVEWPKIDEKAPPALTEAQQASLLRTCDTKSFTGIRDEAMCRLMWDALVRADELLSMTTADIDLKLRRARVRRGKGGRERITAFSAQTARALDRYERRRRHHKAADLTAYWLAHGRGPMSYAALYATLSRRGELVGIDLHPHMWRAGGAIRWRRKGGSTESLMTIAGWRDLKMVMRYTRAAERELAIEEAHRLFERD